TFAKEALAIGRAEPRGNSCARAGSTKKATSRGVQKSVPWRKGMFAVIVVAVGSDVRRCRPNRPAPFSPKLRPGGGCKFRLGGLQHRPPTAFQLRYQQSCLTAQTTGAACPVCSYRTLSKSSFWSGFAT